MQVRLEIIKDLKADVCFSLAHISASATFSLNAKMRSK